MGFELEIPENPQRIISLVPSQTELLFDLGMEDRMVGITKFCVHPRDKVKNYTKIGGTKKFHLDTIAELKPDLIIGNKEENYEEGINALMEDYPVWMSDIYTLEDALDMMRAVGEITDTSGKANKIVKEIRTAFDSLPTSLRPKQALYLIWNAPYMVAGTDTFINEMLKYAGMENVITDSRYPELSAERIHHLNPEVILLSSEPYPFKDKHVEEFSALCPDAEVKIVDGEMFSWYGSRLKLAVGYFQQLACLG